MNASLEIEGEVRLTEAFATFTAAAGGLQVECPRRDFSIAKKPSARPSGIIVPMFQPEDGAAFAVEMGLAIAKAIMDLHAGKIGLTSQLGHGSVFYFSLPIDS